MRKPTMVPFGTAHEYIQGLRLSFLELETFEPDSYYRQKAERSFKEAALTFFKASASIENISNRAQEVTLHYQYQYARIGDDGTEALALELPSMLNGVMLFPGRKATAVFGFAFPSGAWSLVDLQSDMYLEDHQKVSCTWTGHLGAKMVDSSQDAVVAQAEAVLSNRDRARRIVAQNPRLALELGIGDPTRDTGFDDGGVIDINGVTVEAIAESLRCSVEAAGRVVAARQRLGGRFTTLDEIVHGGELSPREEQLVRERVVLLPW